MQHWLKSLAATACVCAAGALGPSASAQAPGPGQVTSAALQAADPALRSEYEALFQRILANPADLDANFRFAEVATRIGDFEAAIGALERVVFYNPNLARVRLELGILYFRLGSYAMAREYFETAIAAPDVAPEVVGRVRGFLAEIDRRLSTTQWSFYGQTGFRHQTNASAGPGSPVVRSFGTTGLLDRRFVRRPDWNFFALGSLRHIYDLENQRGDVWETNVATYNARQFEVTRLNVNLLELQSGPRLALSPDDMPGAYIRPYFVGGVVALGNSYYLGSIGGGVGIGTTLGSLQVEPFVEFRHRDFHNSPQYRTATQQDGDLWTAGVAAGSPLQGTVRWQARAAYVDNETRDRFSYFGYRQANLDLALPLDLAGPWGDRPWTLTPYAGFSYTLYDSPNPLVDPRVRREDREWRVGAGID
ncbi:MAG: tetratricopeptide repeat protein, partial [Pseudomonadota bacterium]|nr:tetratricopeptide repeat protein [Pseudomonadota bacterium]